MTAFASFFFFLVHFDVFRRLPLTNGPKPNDAQFFHFTSPQFAYLPHFIQERILPESLTGEMKADNNLKINC